MKKRIVLLCCFLFTAFYLYSQNNNQVSDAIYTKTFEAESGVVGADLTIKKNVIINGNLALGYPNATERLEVNGNAKIAGNIEAKAVTFQTLTVNTGNLTTLKVSGNSFLEGLVAIGSITPTEKLHVAGNIKAENNLLSDKVITNSIQTGNLNSGEASFTSNITVNQNAIVNGTLGIGTATPQEKLHVAGNVKADNTLLSDKVITNSTQTGNLNSGEAAFANSVSVNENAFVNGSVGIGTATPTEKLHVAGNIKSDNDLFSDKLITNTTQTGVLNSGEASFTNNVNVNQNVIVNGSVGIGTANPSEKLHVAGNLKVDSNINTNGIITTQAEANTITAQTATISNSVSIGNNVIVSGKIGIGVTTPTETLDINGNLKLTGEINAGQNLNVAGNSILNNVEVNGSFVSKNFAAENLNTSGNVTVGQDLSVTGSSILNNLNVTGQLNGHNFSAEEVSTSGNITVGQNLIVNGATQLTGVSVIGNSSVTGDLQVGGSLNVAAITINDLNTNGNTTVSQNLTVGGQGQINGDLDVIGNIKAGIIEASEFRTTGGGSPFNFENAVITQTIAVASDRVPDNYRMAVGGNIIATGIDIKIPQKWPDYVFTDGHKLLTIEEVAEFIKEHGHLPNVFSAKEMEEKKNYSVSEMDAKLLEKIEELTLYIIQLENRLKALEKH